MRPRTDKTGMNRHRCGGLIPTGMTGSDRIDHHGPAASVAHRRPDSILDALGWRRLCLVVWRASPLPWRLITFPYGLIVYRRLFAASDTLRYLHAMHAAQYDSSRAFRLLRPRYHKVEQLLRDYGFSDRARQEEAEKVGT